MKMPKKGANRSWVKKIEPESQNARQAHGRLPKEWLSKIGASAGILCSPGGSFKLGGIMASGGSSPRGIAAKTGYPNHDYPGPWEGFEVVQACTNGL